MSNFFLPEAQAHGAIGFRSISPKPRRALLLGAAVLTLALVASLVLRPPEQGRGVLLVGVAFLWLWVLVGVPVWNRFIVRPLCRYTIRSRPRDHKSFYRLFEAGYLVCFLWVLLGHLYLVWLS